MLTHEYIKSKEEEEEDPYYTVGEFKYDNYNKNNVV